MRGRHQEPHLSRSARKVDHPETQSQRPGHPRGDSASMNDCLVDRLSYAGNPFLIPRLNRRRLTGRALYMEMPSWPQFSPPENAEYGRHDCEENSAASDKQGDRSDQEEKERASVAWGRSVRRNRSDVRQRVRGRSKNNPLIGHAHALLIAVEGCFFGHTRVLYVRRLGRVKVSDLRSGGRALDV